MTSALQVILPSIDNTWAVRPSPSVPRPTKDDEEWCIAHPGQPNRPPQNALFSVLDFKLMNAQLPRCLVHPFIPEEEKIGMTLTDLEVCPDLMVKCGIGAGRSPSPTMFYRLEKEFSPDNGNARYRAIPGDAFLIACREDDMTVFIDPEIPIPASWTPSNPNASLKEQRKEKLELYRSLNASRGSRIITVVWEYFTVRTAKGWRRKTTAYEKGTTSPFEFQYFDTR